MNELRQSTRVLLERAMKQDGPPAHSRRRIEGALMASVVTTALSHAAAAAEAAVKLGASPSLWTMLSTGKLGFVVATSIGLATGSVVLAVVAPPQHRTAVVTTAPGPVASAPRLGSKQVPVFQGVPVAATDKEMEPDASQPIPPPSSLPSKLSVGDETRLLGQVQEALRNGSGPRALALLERYRKQFGQGVLAEEARAAEVFALCSIGDRSGAKRSAMDFIRNFPGSPILPRVYASCGMSEARE